MRIFMLVVIVVAMIVPALSYGYDRSYNYFDKHGSYRGSVVDDGDHVDYYNRHNDPEGSYDRDSGATFDSHNNFKGWVEDSNDDD